MPLPHWPTPAGQEQWDVPCFHLDTFIMTKEQQQQWEKRRKKTWPRKADRRVEGTRPGSPRHANVPDDFALGGIWQAWCG